MSARELIASKRNEILRLALNHGASNLRLIGSVARREDRADSDVDLLVNWEPGTSLLDHAALMLDLQHLLGRKVDIASDGWLKPRVKEQVHRDAVPL